MPRLGLGHGDHIDIVQDELHDEEAEYESHPVKHVSPESYGRKRVFGLVDEVIERDDWPNDVERSVQDVREIVFV